jgi:2-C-methyl-D-erythritol 4-phosphate cytidylyltransferase
MNIAIIAAAGQGKRMDGRRAKQFLKLAGTPIIIHTLKRFEQCDYIHKIVVVLPASDLNGFAALIAEYDLHKPLRVVEGGETRAESVKRGLVASGAGETDVIVVHDGVRPFVTLEEITSTIRAAEESGASVLVAPATDTIKEIRDGMVVRTLDRAQLRRALTPQCFRYGVLWRAFEKASESAKDATDCSALVESLGETVSIVEGSARNIKITSPEDILFGEILLEQDSEFSTQKSEFRSQNR